MDTQLPVETDGHGSLLLGGGKPAPVPSDLWAQLPPFPGLAVVKPAAVPAPPMVPAEAPAEVKVAMLMDAYATTLRRKQPRQWNPHTTEKLKPAERKLLEAAGTALTEQKLSPLRWCEFSFDQYAAGREADITDGKKPRAERPPLRVVFALKRIEEASGWARTDYERRGERLIVTRSLASLITRWRAMTASVFSGACSVDAAKAQHLPADTYARLLAKSQAEAKQEQADIDRRLASGEYLW